VAEKQFGLLHDRRIEAFSEPVIDEREEIAGFCAVALVTPEGREVGGGAQFKQFCTLAPCDRESPVVTLLGHGSIASRIQQIAS
jgi:hypothetical protein